MKVILATPYYPQPRGNTVTVERISLGLNRLGIETEIVSTTGERPYPLPVADLIHGFNAYHFHKYLTLTGSLSYPYIVTLTGTDLNYNLFDEKLKDKVIQTLKNSKAIHVFNEEAKSGLWREVPEVRDKTFLIPQGINDFPSKLGKINQEKGSFIFLLPAGIRRVKNIASAISMLNPLQEEDSRIKLWIVGPIIEKDEGNNVREIVKQNSHWIKYLGEVPHIKMGEIYRHADVVLNTSLAEGQSSAILEGMAMGIPVLVSNVAGNRDIVQHGETGFLYSSQEDFKYYVHRLMEEDSLRRSIGLMGQTYVKNNHSIEKEAYALRNIYYQILGQSGG